MAHSLGYPTDNNRQPDRKERSREKQRGSRCGSRDEEALCLPKCDLYIRYSNTKYNNYFNLTVGNDGCTTSRSAIDLRSNAKESLMDTTEREAVGLTRIQGTAAK